MELGGSDTPGDVPRSSRRARVIRTLAPQTFLEVTDEEVDRALRYDRPLSVLMGQLEGVVRIRKAEGAQIAEEVVASAVERIARGLRRMDRIGRLGVGEFAVLLPETRLANAEIAALRLRDSFASEPVETRAGPRPLSLNIGISTVNPRIRDAKKFLMLACAQLRIARHVGNGEISTVPPDLVRVSVARNASIH
jgi:diguanylate cyclase (GGDEF)-like protein